MTAINREALKMFVLDVLRHDIEPLESILKLLNNGGCIGWRNYWPHDFTEAEVADVLIELVRDKMIQALVYAKGKRELVACAVLNSDRFIAAQSVWFSLTDKGRTAWEKWEPPTTAEN